MKSPDNLPLYGWNCQSEAPPCWAKSERGESEPTYKEWQLTQINLVLGK